MKYLIEAIVITLSCLLFWLVCYLATGTDRKNLVGLRSYPDEVIKKVRENPELGKYASETKNPFVIFFSNMMLFLALMFVLSLILKYTIGFTDWLDAFLFNLILGEALNLFDLVVIDLLWWRNSKRIRFSFIQDPSLYKDSKKHLISFYKGILMFAMDAALVALFVYLLPAK